MSAVSTLVVADRLKTRKTMIARLKELGYEVTAIATSEEAVEHTRLPRLPYEIAFVDLNIRNGEGIRCLCQLRDQNPRIVLVAITRHAEHELIQEAYRSGAVAFIHSLVDLTDLNHFLSRLSRDAQVRRTSRPTPTQGVSVTH